MAAICKVSVGAEPAIPPVDCEVATEQAAVVPMLACRARTFRFHEVNVIARADLHVKSDELRREVQRQLLLEVSQRVHRPSYHLVCHVLREHQPGQLEPAGDGSLRLVVLEAVAHIGQVPPAPMTLDHVPRSLLVVLVKATVFMVVRVDECFHAPLSLSQGLRQPPEVTSLHGFQQ